MEVYEDYRHRPQKLRDQHGCFYFEYEKLISNETIELNDQFILFWSSEIAWSNELLLVSELLEANSVKFVEVFRENEFQNNKGWYYINNKNDTVYLDELYINSNQKLPKVIQLPILYDETNKQIVEQKTKKILNLLLCSTKKDNLDLFPEKIKDELTHQCAWINQHITLPIYILMFTKNMEQYIEAYNTLKVSLYELEKKLDSQRFLHGEYVYLSDVKLFSILIRFDTFYSRYISPFSKRITDMQNISNYLRDLYQIPQFFNNTNFRIFGANWDIDKQPSSYWLSSFYDMVVPTTDWDTIWKLSSEREKLSSNPAKKFINIKY